MKAGFIGCGSMGGALLRACARASAAELLACDRHAAKTEALSRAAGAAIAGAQEIASNCDYIFLGVKPQALEAALMPLRPLLAGRATPFALVSMAAGISIQRLRELAGGDYPVIRIMPNLAVEVGEGMTLWTQAGASARQTARFEELMRFSGRLMELPEALMDAGTAVSGCAPAFACMFIEALADGGVKCGLRRADAQNLAAQAVLGAAALIISGRHPGEVKDAVCSPAGSTIEGVLRLEAGAFRSDAAQAVLASYDRLSP